MSDSDTALELLRSVNPVPSVDALDRDELADSVVACERLVRESSGESSGAVTVVTDHPAGERVRSGRGFRPVLVAAAVWAVLVMTVATIAFLVTWATAPPDPADRPITTLPADDAMPTTTTVAVDLGYEVVDYDLVYWTDDETTLTVDVYRPATGAGPWPVVVAYPYYAAGVADAGTARALASRGAVVFAPVVIPSTGYDDPADYIDGFVFDRGACAVGFAQGHAAEYGGDPARTTVIGSGGGEHHAIWAALGLERNDVCDEPVRHAPVGLVVGLPQLLFQVDYWDQAIADPTTNARDTLDRYWNSDRWRFSDELTVYIWAGTEGSNARQITTPITDDSWIHSRDVTGTLVADLAAFGAFDDGVIRYDDNAQLLYSAMRRAGISVTLDQMATNSWPLQEDQYDRMWSIVSGS